MAIKYHIKKEVIKSSLSSGIYFKVLLGKDVKGVFYTREQAEKYIEKILNFKE